MISKKFEYDYEIDQIKNMIQELSVDLGSKENGFVQYPVENIDLLKNLICDSEFCFGRFEDDNTMSGFLLAYPLKNLIGEIVEKDPIIHHIKQSDTYPQNSIYFDVVGISKQFQGKGRALRMIAEMKAKAKSKGYEYLIGPIVISPHKNELSIKLVESLGGICKDQLEDKGLTFGIYVLPV